MSPSTFSWLESDTIKELKGILGRFKMFMRGRNGNPLHGDHRHTHVDSAANRVAYVAFRNVGIFHVLERIERIRGNL